MRKRIIAAGAFIVLGSLALAGCSSTGFYSSAPAAQTGMEYVVGHRNSRRAVYLCPTGGSSAECQRVEVTD